MADTWYSQPGWYSNSPREMLPSKIKSIVAEVSGSKIHMTATIYSQFTEWQNVTLSAGVLGVGWSDTQKSAYLLGLQDNQIVADVEHAGATHVRVRAASAELIVPLAVNNVVSVPQPVPVAMAVAQPGPVAASPPAAPARQNWELKLAQPFIFFAVAVIVIAFLNRK